MIVKLPASERVKSRYDARTNEALTSFDTAGARSGIDFTWNESASHRDTS